MIPLGWAIFGGLVMFWVGFMFCAWCTAGRTDELECALAWLLSDPEKVAWDNARAVLLNQ